MCAIIILRTSLKLWISSYWRKLRFRSRFSKNPSSILKCISKFIIFIINLNWQLKRLFVSHWLNFKNSQPYCVYRTVVESSVKKLKTYIRLLITTLFLLWLWSAEWARFTLFTDRMTARKKKMFYFKQKQVGDHKIVTSIWGDLQLCFTSRTAGSYRMTLLNQSKYVPEQLKI